MEELKGRRVLVIDADPIARRGVAETLLSWGADVVEAATVAGADRIEHRPDAVLVSLGAHHDTGAAVVDRVRAHWPGVPVIAYSVLPSDRLDLHLPPGDVVVLSKPIPTQELRQELVARLHD